MGFALEQIDEAGAQKALSGLQMMGSPGGDDAGLPATGLLPTMPTGPERGTPCVWACRDGSCRSPRAAATGQVEVAGVVRLIDLSLLPGPLLPGEHVLVHSGIALERMSAEQAQRGESLFAPPAVVREDVAQDQRLPG